ncbi:hypothetical protein C8D95_101103 [Silicimonas algicola]|uniref:Type IV pilus biogenesis protein PilP n=2 Tax=Silicimonas algicola TaxID=1826607 RepID=A0A316GTC2_9RHOB|nr:hypothetical protein [Silicimonas algicola]PWK58297.1 hypothetical protein C8D95_101103 [Silicimonas algicola]
MTSRWGYDLDMSAIRLMRRDGKTWREIGAVKIDGPDIEDRLFAMSAHMDDPSDPVMLFLPRDQILYMDVDISSEDAVEVDIHRALDGRTPYVLDELEIDWEMTAPGQARVAAIALETLDEAAAFAEARGLRIAGYSSLAARSDFPRPPDFGRPNMMDDLDEPVAVPVVEDEVPSEAAAPEEAVEAVSNVAMDVAPESVAPVVDEPTAEVQVSYVSVGPAEIPAAVVEVGVSDEIPLDETTEDAGTVVDQDVVPETETVTDDEPTATADDGLEVSADAEASDEPDAEEAADEQSEPEEADDRASLPADVVRSRLILGNLAEDDEAAPAEDDASEPVVPHNFHTKRETSRPPSTPVSFSPDAIGEPVLKVDDPRPVMTVRPRSLAPLHPGVPVNGPKVPPRVRTDIAAGTMRRQVASLTPPAAASVRAAPRAGGTIRTLAVLAVAFILTIGIATLVWSLLPLRPSEATVPTVPRPVANDLGAVTQVEPEQQAAVVPEPTEAPIVDAAPTVAATDPLTPTAPEERPAGTAAAVPDAAVGTDQTAALAPAPAEDAGPSVDTAAVAAPEPDLPVPSVETTVAEVPSVAVDEAEPTELAALSRPVTASAPKLTKLLRSGEGRPLYDPQPPFAVAPDGLSAIMTAAPFPGPDTDEDIAETTNDIYIASIEPSDLAFDAIALPAPAGLSGDRIPTVEAAPSPPAEPEDEVAALPEAAQADADAGLRAAIDAATELALSEAEPAVAAEAETVEDPGLPALTAFAQGLPERLPKGRPGGFVQEIERQQFNGLTRSELEGRRPPGRPESAQDVAVREQDAGTEASALAVPTSLSPRGRPDAFEAVVSAALVRQEAARLTASLDFETPNTSDAIEAALEQDIEPEPRPQDTPRLAIPSNASVSRTATIEDAIRLNSLNLVGVYGTPADRRALIRLPSGRYVKVKVGDRFDGGTVAQITDTQLHYRKGNQTVSLSLPRG